MPRCQLNRVGRKGLDGTTATHKMQAVLEKREREFYGTILSAVIGQAAKVKTQQSVAKTGLDVCPNCSIGMEFNWF